MRIGILRENVMNNVSCVQFIDSLFILMRGLSGVNTQQSKDDKSDINYIFDTLLKASPQSYIISWASQ